MPTPHTINSRLQRKNFRVVRLGTKGAIAADTAFIACAAQGTSDGDYTIFVRQDASDRQLMNIAVNSNAFTGTAERPGFFHKPLLLAASTTVSFDVTDLSGSTNQVWFTLAGFKVYNRKLG